MGKAWPNKSKREVDQIESILDDQHLNKYKTYSRSQWLVKKLQQHNSPERKPGTRTPRRSRP